MKKTKKMLAWMLLASMPMTGAAALAESVERASIPLEIRDFEHFPSYAFDSAAGKWSVRANPADALIDRFWDYGINYGTALCAFNLELEGNALTGVWTPVLRFYYMNGQKDINARAVSILVDGTRYDLAAASGETFNGRRSAELISAPLTKEALTAVQAMISGESVSVRLIGDAIYTAELDPETTVTRRRVEAASLNGLQPAMDLLTEAGLNEYALWDLSADAWKNEYGFAPAFAQSALNFTLGENSINDDFGMVVRNDQTKAARTAQELLIEYGFMSGSSTGTFGSLSSEAARRAQRYLGMIETGCMDAQLAAALAAGRASVASEAIEMDKLGDVAEISIDRYWFADGVSAANGPADVRTVYNSDNVLLAADGLIRNISPKELHLFMEMEASVVYGGAYTYEATVVCERSEGRELDSSMLPMAQSRLIVYAEVPAHLAQDADAQWHIELSAGGETLKYVLQ